MTTICYFVGALYVCNGMQPAPIPKAPPCLSCWQEQRERVWEAEVARWRERGLRR